MAESLPNLNPPMDGCDMAETSVSGACRQSGEVVLGDSLLGDFLGLRKGGKSGGRPPVRFVRPFHGSRQAIHWLLILVILPFAVGGWSLHMLMPNHDHSACVHSHGFLPRPHENDGHGNNGHGHDGHGHDGHGHDGHGHSHVVDDASESDPSELPSMVKALDHQCELCQLLTQWRYVQVAAVEPPSSLLTFSTRQLQLQNAVIASLNPYYLRGPPTGHSI